MKNVSIEGIQPKYDVDDIIWIDTRDAHFKYPDDYNYIGPAKITDFLGLGQHIFDWNPDAANKIFYEIVVPVDMGPTIINEEAIKYLADTQENKTNKKLSFNT